MNEDLSFSLEAPEIEWSDGNTNNDYIDLNNTEYAKEIKAATCAKLRYLIRCFRAWKEISRRQRNAKVNKIIGIRWKIEFVQRKFLNKWRMFQKGADILHRFTNQRQLANSFKIWTAFVAKQQQISEKFADLCELQRIQTQKRSLTEWKRVLVLKRKYLWYSTHDDSMLGKKVVNAFFLYLNKLSLWRQAFRQISENAMYSRLSTRFLQWRKALKIRRLTKIYTKRSRRRILNTFISTWRSQFRRKLAIKRKLRVFHMRQRLWILTNAFDQWIDRLESDAHERDTKAIAVESTHYHIQKRAWEKWTKDFHLSLYVTRMETQLLKRLNNLSLRRVFGFWFNSYEEHSAEAALFTNAFDEMEFGRMNRAFDRWLARLDLAVKFREDVASLRIILDKSLMKRKFVEWHGQYIAISRNRAAFEKAKMFRMCYLENKSFQTLVAYAKRAKRDKKKTRVTETVTKKCLIRHSFMLWKKAAIKYRRRKFLIRSVLREWARGIQKRQFEKWKLFMSHRHEMNSKYEEAAKLHQQRRIVGFIRGFIQGAPVFSHEEPEQPKRQENLSFEFEGVRIEDHEQPVLSQPKRPSFLRAQPATTSDEQLSSMQRRLNTLIQIGCQNKDQRSEMVHLIRMINRTRGKPYS